MNFDETTPTRVVIADSHEIVRDGIAMRLRMSTATEVVGEAQDGFSTIKACRQLEPEILFLDLELKRASGRETFLRLRQLQPNLKIIIMSDQTTVADTFTLISHGAFGFMSKNAKGAHFACAVQTVAMGYALFPGDYLNDFVDIRENVSKSGNVFGLSRREIEVLRACGRGTRTKDIAKELHISVRTVETHRYAIYRKTECNNIEELPELIKKLDLGML